MSGMPRGRPQEVTDEELLKIAKRTQGPCFTVAEVAADVSIGAETVRGRLDDLVEMGVLCVKKPSSEKIYWIQAGQGVTETQSEVVP